MVSWISEKMAATRMSGDALRLFQLHSQFSHVSEVEQRLAKIADLQEAALQHTLDDVATLERHNLQLKQSLLTSLRTLKASIGDDFAQEATCANVAGRLDLLSSLQNTSKSQVLLNDHALTEPSQEPWLSSPMFPPPLQVSPPPSTEDASMLGVPMKFGSSRALVLDIEQGSDEDAVTEKVESNLSGTFGTPVWSENATTVFIRNMPPRSTIDELLKAFPPDGSYDFMNLPFNIKARRTSSFATINFVSVDLARAFCKRFDGQRLPHSTRNCKSPLSMGPANIQGLEANLLFLGGENNVSEIRNPELLPRLYLCSAATERLKAAGPHCVKQPDEPGQPHRLDFRTVLGLLNTTEA